MNVKHSTFSFCLVHSEVPDNDVAFRNFTFLILHTLFLVHSQVGILLKIVRCFILLFIKIVTQIYLQIRADLLLKMFAAVKN